MGQHHRFTGTESAYDWAGVTDKDIDPRKTEGVTGKLLVGQRDGAEDFRIRYFRVAPGGHSALERHPHDHGVYILHGEARVTMGSQEIRVGPRDVVYISGNELHQFEALGEEPLGFLCVVPAR